MAKPKKPVAGTHKAFMIMEAVGMVGGGFPAYMNMIMRDMEKAMEAEGYRGPYQWSFSGGDGYAVPVILRCEFV